MRDIVRCNGSDQHGYESAEQRQGLQLRFPRVNHAEDRQACGAEPANSGISATRPHGLHCACAPRQAGISHERQRRHVECSSSTHENQQSGIRCQLSDLDDVAD